jgi:2-methylcitrate dehydratase PrpD
MFGSMCKPFHPGYAAKKGLLAALLAQKNFTNSNLGIEADRGIYNVLSTAFRPAEIDSIVLKSHPLVLELTGKKTPQTGLKGKFSVYHSAAVAIIHGAAGKEEYSDEVVRNPEVIALRNRVTATVGPGIKEGQVRITVKMKGCRVLEKYVEHAIGMPGQTDERRRPRSQIPRLHQWHPDTDRDRRVDPTVPEHRQNQGCE